RYTTLFRSQDRHAQVRVLLLLRLDPPAVLASQRVRLVREHLHLSHVVHEEPDVVLHEQAKPPVRVGLAAEEPLHVFQHRAEAVVLDQEQQLLLAPDVVVEPRETDAGCAADVADARLVIPLLGEDRGRRAQDRRELLVVSWPACPHVPFRPPDRTSGREPRPGKWRGQVENPVAAALAWY